MSDKKEVKFEILGKTIVLERWDSYYRGPLWTEYENIEFYFENDWGIGYFKINIFPEDFDLERSIVREELNEIKDYVLVDNYGLMKEAAKDIFNTICLLLNHLKVKVGEGLIKTAEEASEYFRGMISFVPDTLKRVVSALAEGFIGPTEEYINARKEEIRLHNEKCEKFHKENPYYFLRPLPGISSIFSGDRWKELTEAQDEP